MSSWRNAGLKDKLKSLFVSVYATVQPRCFSKLSHHHLPKPLPNYVVVDLPLNSYVNYSNIAAGVLRRCLKGDQKEAAIKRGQTAIRYFYWFKGDMLAEGEKPKQLEKDRA